MKRHPGRSHKRCPTGKVRYRSEVDARDAISMTKSKPGKMPIRSYPCAECRGWHTTSQPWNGRN